jgi:hypothetical protein
MLRKVCLFDITFGIRDATGIYRLKAESLGELIKTRVSFPSLGLATLISLSFIAGKNRDLSKTVFLLFL